METTFMQRFGRLLYWFSLGMAGLTLVVVSWAALNQKLPPDDAIAAIENRLAKYVAPLSNNRPWETYAGSTRTGPIEQPVTDTDGGTAVAQTVQKRNVFDQFDEQTATSAETNRGVASAAGKLIIDHSKWIADNAYEFSSDEQWSSYVTAFLRSCDKWLGGAPDVVEREEVASACGKVLAQRQWDRQWAHFVGQQLPFLLIFGAAPAFVMFLLGRGLRYLFAAE
jgi:hypothetical protein